MTESEFLQSFTQILRGELDDNSIVPTMSSGQSDISGWDSVAQVRIIMRTEATFGVQFEMEEIEEMHSVADFFAVIKRHQG